MAADPNSSFNKDWFWTESHALMLLDICLEIGLPIALGGLIECFVYTSAVILAKPYSKHIFQKYQSLGSSPYNPINILIMGPPQSGKSTIAGRFDKDEFFERIDYSQRKGLNIMGSQNACTQSYRSIIDIDIGNERLKRFSLLLYDHHISSSMINNFSNDVYLRKADVIMIVFDVSDKKSYEWILNNSIINKISSAKHDNIIDAEKLPLILVGNKVDEIDKNIDVSQRKGLKTLVKLSNNAKKIISLDCIQKDFCEKYNMSYIEISAKCLVNIEQLFEIAVSEALAFNANGVQYQYID